MNDIEEEEILYCDVCYGETEKDKMKSLVFEVGQMMKTKITVDLCPKCHLDYRIDQKWKKTIKDVDHNDHKHPFHLIQYYGYAERDTPMEKKLKQVITSKAAMTRKTII
jgi:hypothetical protein